MYDIARFGMQHFSVISIDEFSEELLREGIYSLPVGDQTLDWMFTPNRTQSEYFLVGFSGAITNRNGSSAPFFSGKNVSKEVGVPLLAFSDPTLALNSNLPLAWYAGNEGFSDVFVKISEIIRAYSISLNSRPVLFGASGGGFASLSISDRLDVKHSVMVWNPQTSITKYNIKHVVEYVKTAFPSKQELLLSAKDDTDLRRISREIMDNSHVINSVLNGRSNENSDILYLQNDTDWHVEAHAKPYINNKKLEPIQDGVYGDKWKKTIICFSNWGEGHAQMPKDFVVRVLADICKGLPVEKCALRLKDRFSRRGNTESPKKVKKSIDPKGVRFLSGDLCIALFDAGGCGFHKLESGYEFAAYLYIDKKRVQSVWYQNKCIIKFDVSKYSNSEPDVLGFVRSGEIKVKIPTKKIECIGFADENRQLYVSISKDLIDFGLFPNFSADGVELNVAQVSDQEIRPLLSREGFERFSNIELCTFRIDSELTGAKTLTPFLELDGVKVPIGWSDPRLSLEYLATLDEKTFMRRFTYAANRHRDNYVAEFIAKNNLRLDAPSNIRVNSTVIVVYKVLEREPSKTSCFDLLKIIDEVQPEIEFLNFEVGARKDKLHLQLSLLMAKIHVLLALGDWHGIVEQSLIARDAINAVEFRGYYSVNFAKTLMLGAIAAFKIDRNEFFSLFLREFDGVVKKVDFCIESNQSGWMYSERKHVDILADYASRLLAGDILFKNECQLFEILRAAARINSAVYLSSVKGALK